jgi:hypothetical protein
LYINNGEYSKAEPLLLEAMAIIKNALGSEHPEFATSLANLAILYEIEGDYPKAESMFLEVERNILLNTDKSFDFLSENEKEQYLSTVIYDFEAYQSFLKNYYPIKPSAAAESYNIELATKGVILSSDIKLREAIQASGDRNAMALFSHLTSLKNTLSKLYSIPVTKRLLNTDSIENLANNDEKELIRLLNLPHSGIITPGNGQIRYCIPRLC